MRVLFAGGGTGGHIYPAIAIAKALKATEHNTEIMFLGAERGMECQLVPKEGFNLHTVPVSGLSRKNPLQAANALLLAAAGVQRARRIVREFRPDVAVGTGGYVSGPVILAAALSGVPTLIHEQNAFPGLTTRALSRFARVVAVSHSEAKEHLGRARKVVVTGMPIREAFFSMTKNEGRRRLGIPDDAKVVLAVGGSGGALHMNKVLAEAAPELLADPHTLLLQISGERYYERVVSWQTELSLEADTRSRWQIIRFMYDMPAALAAADLVISRAGSSTLAEIAAVGTPAIIIPSPNVTDNHQEHNANALVRKEAALMIRDQLLSRQTLLYNVESLFKQPHRLTQMAENSRKASFPHATDDLVRLVIDLSSS